ncbi:integron integrase, partial [Pseudoxanthomonas sp. SGD-10]
MSYEGEQTAISGGVARDGTPRLLDQVRGRLRLKHYSLRTEQAYLYWIRRYVRAWLPRHPAELDGAAVEA